MRDQLNAILRGWSNYFRCGSRYVQFRAVDHYVYDRVVHFQRRRHQTQSRGTTQYSEARVFGELGVLRLRVIWRWRWLRVLVGEVCRKAGCLNWTRPV